MPLYNPPDKPRKKFNQDYQKVVLQTYEERMRAQQTGDSYRTALQTYKEDLDFLNSKEDSNWMEVEFEQALQFSASEWGPTEYILNKKTPPITNAKSRRTYSDMTTSRLRYTQGGTFLSSGQIVEVEEDQDAGNVSDEDKDEEDNEENDQPPRTRRRLDWC